MKFKITPTPIYLKVIYLCALQLVIFQNKIAAQHNYAKLVNSFIGTGGHGHTFPGPVAPFGMVQVGPDTRLEGWDGCSGYHYSDSIIYGFSHTHLSGTGCSDYGDILLMPIVTDEKVVGDANSYFNNKNYSSKFSHANETAKAGYYKVKLDKYNIVAELTTTTRVGMHQYQFPKTANASVVLDLVHRDEVLDAYLEIVNDSTIRGYRHSKAWAENQHLFFYIQFSKKFKNVNLIEGANSNVTKQAKGKKVKGLFTFDAMDQKALIVKVAISGVDMEGAQKNMEAELPGWNFNKTKEACEALWNTELNKIQVSGGTNEEQIVFYTALYHCFIHPSIYNDVDGRYMGRDFKIYNADGFNYYTVFSIWDTFRALHPLFNLVQRERNLDFIKTFLEQYKQVGRLPVWELSSNETECMIGYHAVSVIADAYSKGNSAFDTKLAQEACLKATKFKNFGIPTYHSKGFLEVEDESESVSKNLEYAYDDWCVESFLLETIDAKNIANHVEWKSNDINSSKGWRNLFDPETHFMRPRANGDFYSPFNPSEVNNNFTEANSWQYSLFVPHDIIGLKQAFGGDKKFEERLDALFSASSNLDGRQQADITGLIGQYAHGNEPSHHMAYLYNYINKPSKTQFRVNQLVKEMYHNAPDGLAGNEDCGQMSAWYVMSTMGFYAVCPGANNYAVTGSIFDEVKFNYNSSRISLKHHRTNKNQIYVDSINSNISFNKAYLNFRKPENALMVWEAPFEHKNEKNNQIVYDFYYGNKANDEPARSLNHQIEKMILDENVNRSFNQVLAPVISAGKKSYKDSLLIDIKTFNDYYTDVFITTNDNTVQKVKKQNEPLRFYINQSCKIVAKSYNFCGTENGVSSCQDSAVIAANFYRIPHNWTIKLFTEYNKQYTAGGPDGLLDGIYGEKDWRKGGWQGYQHQDFEAVIDLKGEKMLSSFSSSYLQDQMPWILYPSQVSYYVSDDGKNFVLAGIVKNEVTTHTEKTELQKLALNLAQPINAHYVKVVAKNYGKLPEWHLSAGQDAFIFIDEIELK